MPTPQWNLPDDEPDIDPDNPDDEGPEPPPTPGMRAKRL